MRKIIAFMVLCSLSVVVNAQVSQNQMKEISRKVVEETLISSKLKDSYSVALRSYLERVMLNEQVISLMMKLTNENSVSSVSEAEKMGFNLMTALREKSMLTLSDNDLYELLKLNLNLMSNMTDYECAQYVKKKRTDEDGLGRNLYEISGKLRENLFKEYIGYYDKALSNILSNKSFATKLSDKEIIEVKEEFQEIMRELVANNKFVSDFFAKGKSFAVSPNSDVCRIGKELLTAVVSGDSVKAKKRASAYINNQLN